LNERFERIRALRTTDARVHAGRRCL
jgi:hypothetical protein